MIWILKSPVTWWVVAGLLVFGAGFKTASMLGEADKQAAIIRAIEQAQAQSEEDAAIAAAFAEDSQQTRVRYKTITREVIRYAKSDSGRCQPDAEFVRLWNAANQAATANRPDDQLRPGTDNS